MREQINTAAMRFSIFDGEVWLDTTEAAAYIGKSESSLVGYRRRGIGPAFYKTEGSIYYKQVDIDAWLEACRVEPKAVAGGAL